MVAVVDGRSSIVAREIYSDIRQSVGFAALDRLALNGKPSEGHVTALTALASASRGEHGSKQTGKATRYFIDA